MELADVTDGDAVAAMVERVEREMGPLAGVFHGAAVLSDGALGEPGLGAVRAGVVAEGEGSVAPASGDRGT